MKPVLKNTSYIKNHDKGEFVKTTQSTRNVTDVITLESDEDEIEVKC